MLRRVSYTELTSLRDEVSVLAQLMRMQSAEVRDSLQAFRAQSGDLNTTLMALQQSVRFKKYGQIHCLVCFRLVCVFVSASIFFLHC